jgi:hypothetical protein
MAKRRLSAAQRASVLEEWVQSGLSVPAFCRQRGLSYSTMKGWLYKPGLPRAIESAHRDRRALRTEPTRSRMPSAPSPEFVSVQLAQVPRLPVGPPAEPQSIAVILGGGRRVVVERGFDPETLRQVVSALESSSC